MDLPYLDEIVVGDCREVLKKLPDASVNLIITSPPYFNQRTYTENDDRELGTERKIEQYLDNLIDIFRQCVRVVRDDGSLIVNMGDKYVNTNLMLVPYRFAIRACDATAVTLINNICWHKTNPTPRQYQRRLVSSHEPFFHFVKTGDYYYDSTVFEEKKSQRRTTDKMGMKYAEQIDNSGLSDAEKAEAQEALARVVSKVRRGELWSFRMKIRGLHKLAYGGYEGGRNAEIARRGFSVIEMPGKIIQKDVFTFPTEKIHWNKHPAIYPEALVRKLIMLTTREGDVVLDPFIGSGTTGVACRRCNRRFIGVELCEDFADVARERIWQ